MEAAIEIRPSGSEDAHAMRRLDARCADAGKVAVRPHFNLDPAEVALARPADSVGFVALANQQVIGSGRVTFSRVAVGARDVTLAWLASLQVDPDWRGRGVARALTNARLALVAERGEPCIVGAAIQDGNRISMANAMRWADTCSGTIRVTPIPPPRRAPSRGTGLVMRNAEAGDLEQVVAGIRATSASLALAPILDVDELAAWLALQIDGAPLRDYVVASDSSGQVVAGLGLEDEGRLRSLEVTRMPLSIAAVNVVLRVVPKDRRIRNLATRLAWYRPGAEEAARELWQAARWTFRHRGTGIVRTIDPQGPLAGVLSVPGWLPSTSLQIMTRGLAAVSDRRLPLGVVV